MEPNKQSIGEIEKKTDENLVKNPVKKEKFEDIIYKLVMDRELDEKEIEVIDSIVEKKDEKIYNDKDKDDEEVLEEE